MRDRPIIFSAPMIRALLDGRKTQTRCVLKKQPGGGIDGCYHRPDGRWIWLVCGGNQRASNTACGPGVGVGEPFPLPYAPGDRLWVRENVVKTPAGVAYAVDGGDHYGAGGKLKVTPSIHMPRAFSRLTLIVESVKVERLRDISDEDAEREGIYERSAVGDDPMSSTWTWKDDGWRYDAPRDAFCALWMSINGADSWQANPWVCAIGFRVIKANIDSEEARP
jgi:hypothetical protein